ncbi:MAG: cytochrome P460 family protein [Daejeonella sp.]
MNYIRNIITLVVLGTLISLGSFSFTSTEINKQSGKLLEIAKEYKKYTVQVDRSSSFKWTVAACMAPLITKADSMHFSKANPKKSPHGNKLYKFFVKDLHSYTDPSVKTQPVGQVLVKETWNVKEISGGESASTEKLVAKKSKNDGKWYSPTTVSELFIMYKEKKNKNNDEGWVYGVVSLEKPDVSSAVLAKGKISTCIGCHAGTKYDRMFGKN